MIRPATPSDARALHSLVRELARYERLEAEVTGSDHDLEKHLFGPRPFAEALVAEEDGEGSVVGFALYFHSYSTFLARPGIYLEDLFVLPDHRRRGHGRALLREIARIALARGCGRFEWSVLEWNAPAIAFYESLGAECMGEWRIFRMTGESIARLASGQGAARL